jgi:DNA-directed RNA polymerase specialized sigma24 family protein
VARRKFPRGSARDSRGATPPDRWDWSLLRKQARSSASRWLRCYSVQGVSAGDLAQAAIVHLLKKLRVAAPDEVPRDPERWLSTTVRYELIGVLKKRDRQRRLKRDEPARQRALRGAADDPVSEAAADECAAPNARPSAADDWLVNLYRRHRTLRAVAHLTGLPKHGVSAQLKWKHLKDAGLVRDADASPLLARNALLKRLGFSANERAFLLHLSREALKKRVRRARGTDGDPGAAGDPRPVFPP